MLVNISKIFKIIATLLIVSSANCNCIYSSNSSLLEYINIKEKQEYLSFEKYLKYQYPECQNNDTIFCANHYIDFTISQLNYVIKSEIVSDLIVELREKHSIFNFYSTTSICGYLGELNLSENFKSRVFICIENYNDGSKASSIFLINSNNSSILSIICLSRNYINGGFGGYSNYSIISEKNQFTINDKTYHYNLLKRFLCRNNEKKIKSTTLKFKIISKNGKLKKTI